MDIFSEKTILTVTRLTALLRGVIEENFEQVWVQGEVSNLSMPSSGHIYFSLKDSGAQLRCVMFKGSVKNLKFRPADGMGLIARGRISVYDQRGEYQLICEYLEPAGIGALQRAFEQLKERLAAEGLFASEHKKPLPALPRRVGIITSPTGAVIHDILNVLKRRFASLEILLCPVRVQGEGASVEIARAIDDMNRFGEVDVLIVGRGGGSLEDLWAFNEEPLARAVFRSKLPVISAVGHETDWTICDFVADLRAPTPSAAAELVITSTMELQAQLNSLKRGLSLAMTSRIAVLHARVESLRRAIRDPGTSLGHLSQRVDDLTERLSHALDTTLFRRREQAARLETALAHHSPERQFERYRLHMTSLSERLERALRDRLVLSGQTAGRLAARLDVLSPLRTLCRGYALVTTDDGTVVTTVDQLHEKDRLTVRLHRGAAYCTVERLEKP